MVEEYQIVYVEQPAESTMEIVEEGLSSFDTQQIGNRKSQRISFVVQTPDKKIVGGVSGEMNWNWLYVDLLWVKDELRGRGFGHRLMTVIENEAKKLGATKAYLDTYSFQAPEFYKKLGYREFGKLKDFPAGHQKYFLTRDL
jgi:N-acetylglutamate synthase-like GNAT family acetyltransferase